MFFQFLFHPILAPTQTYRVRTSVTAPVVSCCDLCPQDHFTHHPPCTQESVIDEGKPPACLRGFGLSPSLHGQGCVAAIPLSLPHTAHSPTYPLHCDRGIFEVYKVDVPQKGKAEGGGREILWISVLHVVSDEQEDQEEDEERLEGDAVPEEVRHGWMVGLCRDVSHSRSEQAELTGHH